GNGALQSVLTALQPTVLFPPNVQALLSGHVHLFEVVTFATPQPTQIVAGNGGDWIDTPLPLPLPPGTTPAPGTVVAGLVASNRASAASSGAIAPGSSRRAARSIAA